MPVLAFNTEQFWEYGIVHVPVLFVLILLSLWHCYCIRFRFTSLKCYWGSRYTLSSVISSFEMRLRVLLLLSFLILFAPLIHVSIFSLALYNHVEPTLVSLNIILLFSFIYSLLLTLGHFYFNGFFPSKFFKVSLGISAFLLTLIYVLPPQFFHDLSTFTNTYLSFLFINLCLVVVAVYMSSPFPRVDPFPYTQGTRPSDPIKSAPIMRLSSLIVWICSILVLILYDLLSSAEEDNHFAWFSTIGIVFIDLIAFLIKFNSPNKLILLLLTSRLCLVLPGPSYFFLGHVLLGFLVLCIGTVSFLLEKFPLSQESAEDAIKSISGIGQIDSSRPIICTNISFIHCSTFPLILSFFALLIEIFIIKDVDVPEIFMLDNSHSQYIFGVVALFAFLIISIWIFAILYYLKHRFLELSYIIKPNYGPGIAPQTPESPQKVSTKKQINRVAIVVLVICFVITLFFAIPLWSLTKSFINLFCLIFTFPLILSLVLVYSSWKDHNYELILPNSNIFINYLFIFSPILVVLFFSISLIITVPPTFIGVTIFSWFSEFILIGYVLVSYFKTLNFRLKQEISLVIASILIHITWGIYLFLNKDLLNFNLFLIYAILLCLFPPLVLALFAFYDFRDRKYVAVTSTIVTASASLLILTSYAIILTFSINPWYLGANLLAGLYSIIFIAFVAFNIRKTGYFPPYLRLYTLIYVIIAAGVCVYVAGRGDGIFWGSSLTFFLIIGVCLLYSFSLKPMNISSPVISAPFVFPAYCVTDNGQYLTVNFPTFLSLLSFILLSLWGTWASLWLSIPSAPMIVAGISSTLLIIFICSAATRASFLLGKRYSLLSERVISEALSDPELGNTSATWKPTWPGLAMSLNAALPCTPSIDKFADLWSKYDSFSCTFQSDVAFILQTTLRLVKFADGYEFLLSSNLSLYLQSTGKGNLSSKSIQKMTQNDKLNLLNEVSQWLDVVNTRDKEAEIQRRKEEEAERERRRKQEEEELKRKMASGTLSQGEIDRLRLEAEKAKQLELQKQQEAQQKELLQRQLEQAERDRLARLRQEQDQIQKQRELNLQEEDNERLRRFQQQQEEEERRRRKQLERQGGNQDDQKRRELERKLEQEKERRQREFEASCAASAARMEEETKRLEQKRREEEAKVLADLQAEKERLKKQQEDQAEAERRRIAQQFALEQSKLVQSASSALNVPQSQQLLAEYEALASALLAQGRLFTDSEFSASSNSIGKSSLCNNVKWLRIHNDLKGSIFKATPAPDHVKQGVLGNCWLISALAVVATRPELIKQIFVKDGGKAGLYILKFQKNCEWTYVIVDDFLPCRNNKPMFAVSTVPNEYFPSIIEKAYAKLHQSYQNIEGGQVSIGLSDLTGGIADQFSFKNSEVVKDIASGTMWRHMIEYIKRGYLLGAGSPSGKDTDISRFGIVQGHAYSILQCVEVDNLQLIKLRNPWGGEEWNGDFSDNSNKWTPKLKKRLELVAADDGTFWMTFQDFVVHFATLYVCRFFDNVFSNSLRGSWSIAEGTAGGCNNKENEATFKNNPQFRLKSPVPQRCSLVLRQDDRRLTGIGQLHIGLYVTKPNKPGRVTMVSTSNFFARTQFISLREVFKEVDLEANVEYTIVVCTFDANQENGFYLMAFSERSVILESL
ncbi:hypothetical protein RCL1_001338 [Eukaryota sp. TZLM3-RCL]